jgi:hypothetical protein
MPASPTRRLAGQSPTAPAPGTGLGFRSPCPAANNDMKIIYTDVLVIGGGLAGLRLAIGAKRRGHDAIILSLVPPKRSHSARPRKGGMQASLGNVIKGEGDNEDVHFEDTVRGSDWGADQTWCACSSTPHPRPCANWRPGACPGAACAKGDRTVVINGQKVTLTERTRPTASWRSATSAAPRSGAPATPPTAPATPCCTR